ncbi:hypothetical protein BH09MYX1_BH09MYX1_44640 [soil metagenome]
MQLSRLSLRVLFLLGALACDTAAMAEPPSIGRPVVRASADVASYADSNHVFVLTPGISGTVASPTDAWSVSAGYQADVISAASADIVSTASRRWTETRHVGTASGTYKPHSFGFAAHTYVSSEPDYLSISGGVTVSQDFAQKNVTVLLGYDYGHDLSGRSGTPWSVFVRPIDRHSIKSGVTLVLDRATVAAFVLDAVIEHGDTSKPYRFIPLFAPGTYVPNGAPAEWVATTRVAAKPLEQLPVDRIRLSFSGQIAHRFDRLTLRADERLYVDTWGLGASTTDGRLLFDWGRRLTLGPHLRFHAQSAVSFWQRAYTLGANGAIAALRAGDRELGPLVTFTAGASARLGIGPTSAPSSWVLGLDVNAAETRYLDDLYISQRTSVVGGFSLEAEL